MTEFELPAHPLTRADLRALGCGDHTIRTLLRGQKLRRLLRDIYVNNDVPDTLTLRCAAAALAIAPNHVVVDRTAAWLHGIDVLTFAEHEVLPPVETCALRGFHPTETHALRGRSRDLAPHDVMVLDGLRVTTPLRTALDLGCNLRRRDAMAALNMFARKYAITNEHLQREMPRFRRRRGVVQLRELAPWIDPRPESVRETWTLLAIRDAGLPAPELQYWIVIHGIPTFRLDLAYPRSRVYVEYDGYDAHDRTPEQIERDEKRRAWLRDNGWTAIVVRMGDFSAEGLAHWLDALREALSPTYSNRRW